MGPRASTRLGSTRDDVALWLGGSTDHDDFRQRFTDPGDGLTLLAVLRGGDLVGDLMLRVEDAWGQHGVTDLARATVGVLGWVMHPDATGRGLATEAVGELLRHAFEDRGLRRVIAECFADNQPSWRLMEWLGWQDEYVYALLAEEWRDRQAAPNVDASITKR
ncbi:GNAT family N-acetyltransferase [Aeromicrobium fastidiosum]|uniref:GNAT N-acetyltransferase n=1 Tax=Aeromicrobium fastidiosum TaxID=52699 RepID=A0A641ARC6_9ACTN|nr:GNAT family N-acetyltransferase [Aeromicrobium fastidiosum]KAA1380067.1 GNAT N-acetyltransferase [Aeromicrobium fastidiosum]MBP2389593.1 RimJ/RimL family protein N-acetyltransferase [Aeromicrobium fastidiosum]